MSTIVQSNKSTSRLRVAVIIEGGKIKPVWFEEIDNHGRDRIFIKEICSIWSHMEGAVKIISFSVWDGANNYRLSLDTKEFTWKLGIAEGTPFPPTTASSTKHFRRDED
jgi:hypothetical protein